MSREFNSLQVRVALHGGPYDGGHTATDSLDAYKIVFTPDDRAVVYVNQQDGEYLYSPALSDYFSRDVQRTFNKYAGTTFHVQTA